MALAVGVLAGGIGQFLVQIPEIRRLGVPLTPAFDWSHPALREIARRLGPAALSLAAVQITILVNTLLASLLPVGTVSYLYYADRLMEFPLGVFGIAVATAALPSMSAQAARRDHAGLDATLLFTLRLSAFVAVLFVAMYRWLDRWPLLAGFLIALLTVKPQLGLLIPLFLLATGRYRVFAYAAAFTTLLLGASVAVFGTEVWKAYLEIGIANQSTTLVESNAVVMGLMPTAFVNAILVGGSVTRAA